MSPEKSDSDVTSALQSGRPNLGESYARSGDHFHDRGDGGWHSKPGVRGLQDGLVASSDSPSSAWIGPTATRSH